MSTTNALRRPMAAAVYVELRKFVDTRSSRWLLLSMAAAGVATVGIFVALSVTRGQQIDVSLMLTALALPAALGAPIISILGITSDWQHRDVFKFFALQPARGILLLAKYLAVAVFALGMVMIIAVVAVSVAAVVSAIQGAGLITGDLLQSVRLLVCVTIVGSVSGAAIASAVLSTPLAIVFVLFQSLVFDTLIGFVAGVATPYLQSATLTNFLVDGGNGWAALSSAVVWILIPGALGVWRNQTKNVT
jgi:ABC-2 type transport system permease protein